MNEHPLTTDGSGSWWEAIPHPIYGIRKRCVECGAKFWTLDDYRFHYVMKHVVPEWLAREAGNSR